MKVIDKFLSHYDNNQSKAAEALGVSQQLVWWWKNRATDVPLLYVPKVAKLLGVSSKELRPDFFSE